jgi:hypothetical protein
MKRLNKESSSSSASNRSRHPPGARRISNWHISKSSTAIINLKTYHCMAGLTPSRFKDWHCHAGFAAAKVWPMDPVRPGDATPSQSARWHEPHRPSKLEAALPFPHTSKPVAAISYQGENTVSNKRGLF